MLVLFFYEIIRHITLTVKVASSVLVRGLHQYNRLVCLCVCVCVCDLYG